MSDVADVGYQGMNDKIVQLTKQIAKLEKRMVNLQKEKKEILTVVHTAYEHLTQCGELLTGRRCAIAALKTVLSEHKKAGM